MITFFIFYKDLTYATFLSNTIIKSNRNTQSVGLNEKVSKSSITYCNQITPHIIIATDTTHKELSQKLNFNYIAINISQKEALVTQKICNQINKVTSDCIFSRKLDLYNFKKRVYLELQRCKFNTALSGTQYLLDCIMYFHENPYYNLNKVNVRSLYLPIAEKYNTNVETVNWNIHSAISDMSKATTDEFRKKIYGIDEIITPQKIIEMFSNLY